MACLKDVLGVVHVRARIYYIGSKLLKPLSIFWKMCLQEVATCLEDMLRIMHVRTRIHYFGSKLCEPLSSFLADASYFRLHRADS